MSSFIVENYTDDEDSYPNGESVEESSGEVIDESIVESSSVDSEYKLSQNDSSNVTNLKGAIKKSFRRNSSSNQQRSDIISDSDSSEDLDRQTSTNKRDSSKHKIPSFSKKQINAKPLFPSYTKLTKELNEKDNKYEESFTKIRSPKLNSDSDDTVEVSRLAEQNLSSDSESSTDLEVRTSINKQNLMNNTSSTNVTNINEKRKDYETSFMKIRSPKLTSDSEDDDIRVTRKTKKNVISDSESEQDSKVNESMNKLEESLNPIGIVNADVEVEKITKTFNGSRISSEFNFGKKGNIINSTVLDIGNQDTPKAGSKRLFNKSVDTPRILKHLKESSTPKNATPADNSVEILSDDDNDVIDVSSGDTSPPPPVTPRIHVAKKIIKQTTLDSHVTKPVVGERDVIEVCPREMTEQKDKINKIEVDLQKAKNLLRTVNLDSLPDKGKLIRDRHAEIERVLAQEIAKMSKMVVTKEDPIPKPSEILKERGLTWDQIQANVNAVMPRTFGKKAMSTYNAQKAVTMDRLQQLHGSLESCPKEDMLAEDPKGLKVELMPHQRRALAWLMWREKQKPSGGILADDMGLGKTLTMISLMIKVMGEEDRDSDVENQSNKHKGGTLVICPASLLNQWSGELEKRTKRGLVSCEVYHGPKRETKPKRLAEHDMVITTYAIVKNECEKNGAVFRVKWRRIIVDEAHQIRNHKSQTSEAVCRLAAQSRWALTGTPVHNKELDMYALLKFLRCTPFDDIVVWKRWVGDKSTGGQERLHTVISSLMLRRTKAELMHKGALQCMPERKWELVFVELAKPEMDVYQKIMLFSRTLFAQFLHQRAEKNQDALDLRNANFGIQPNGANQEYFKMRDKLLRFHKVRDIKQHEILVLLLRLRQICCHPSLITGMLHEDMEGVDEDGDLDETNILEQLNKLVLNDDKYDHDTSNPAEGISNQADAPGLSEVAKSILNPANAVFSKEKLSSKIKALLDVIKEKIVQTEDKAIIVSQWPSFLRLIAYHLDRERIPFDQLDGSIPVNKRMVMVDKFNDPKDKMKILLLSLTAGGVGLNLIGANYLFLLDLHWNPQLENQAQDRIYRVGQKKPVFVYKFMALDTIEKRILDLQEKKLDIANSMLTGTKQVIGSKLSLDDLKLLFEM